MSVRRRIRYLGRVIWAVNHSRSFRYATLRPLIESDADGVEWKGPIRDAEEQFPERGNVHWPHAPLDAEVGSLWQFGVEAIAPELRGGPERFQCISSAK